MKRAISSASIRSVFARAPPTRSKGLDLRGRQLPRCDFCRFEPRPEPPFLTAATRAIDPPDQLLILAAFKTDQSSSVLCNPDKFFMPF
jgi:hypothetical protein